MKKTKKNWLTTLGGILLAVASVANAYKIPTGKVGTASGADLAGAAAAILVGVAAADARNTKKKEE